MYSEIIHPTIINDDQNKFKTKSKRNKNNPNPKQNSKSPPKQNHTKKNTPIFTIDKIQDNFPDDYRTRRFILLDTETTGLEITSDRLISINAIEMIKGELTGMQFNAYLDKRFYDSQPLMYYLSDYNYSRKDNIKKSLQTFLDFVKDDMIITHNASFDMKFINRELNKFGLDTIPLNRCICTLKYFRNLKKIGIFDKNFGLKLCDLCRYYDIYVNPKDLHQGIVDTIVFGRVVAKMFEDGICNINDLQNDFKNLNGINNYDNFNFNEINDLGRSLGDLHISDLNEDKENYINNDNYDNNNNQNYDDDFIIIENKFDNGKEKKQKNGGKYHCKSEDKKPKRKLNINDFTFNGYKKKNYNKNKNYNNNKINKENKVRKNKNKVFNYMKNPNLEEYANKKTPKKQKEKFNKSKSQNINFEEDDEVKLNFIKNAFKKYITINNIQYKEN